VPITVPPSATAQPRRGRAPRRAVQQRSGHQHVDCGQQRVRRQVRDRVGTAATHALADDVCAAVSSVAQAFPLHDRERRAVWQTSAVDWGR
jgi:hypothetical protein